MNHKGIGSSLGSIKRVRCCLVSVGECDWLDSIILLTGREVKPARSRFRWVVDGLADGEVGDGNLFHRVGDHILSE